MSWSNAQTLPDAALAPAVTQTGTLLHHLGNLLEDGVLARMFVETGVEEEGRPSVRDEAPKWEYDTESALKRLLGAHEAALFASAEDDLPKREPQSTLATDGLLTSWQNIDIRVRWLRRRIEEIRDDQN